MAIDKKPLTFFIYLFGLFIFSIRGNHNNSFKTWFCGAAQQASHARKFLLSQLTTSDRQDWPCLQRRGGSAAGGGSARVRGSLGQHIRLSTPMARQMAPQRLLCTAMGKCFTGKTGKKLVYAGFQHCRTVTCVL